MTTITFGYGNQSIYITIYSHFHSRFICKIQIGVRRLVSRNTHDKLYKIIKMLTFGTVGAGEELKIAVPIVS